MSESDKLIMDYRRQLEEKSKAVLL